MAGDQDDHEAALIAVTDNPEDTLNNCRQMLLIVDLATDAQEMVYYDAPHGYHLIITCVQDALKYEVDRGLTSRENNVTKLEVES